MNRILLILCSIPLLMLAGCEYQTRIQTPLPGLAPLRIQWVDAPTRVPSVAGTEMPDRF